MGLSAKADEGNAWNSAEGAIDNRHQSDNVVHATWCPHCHPATVEPMTKIAGELGIPFFSDGIDIPEQAAKADELVRSFGDWSEDYLVPRSSSKQGRHDSDVLTGYSESVESTKRAVNNLLKSPLFARVK